MSAPQDGADSAQWQDFLARPVSYIDAGRLVAMFGGAVNSALCTRLAAEPRLQPRLNRLVEEHFALPAWTNETCGAQDRAIALMPPGELLALARRAGTIYWSASIASVVLAPDIRTLHGTIGEDLCAAALAQRDLSGPVQPIKPFETLAERIEADGRLCLAGWIAAQAPAVSARVRLKWSDPFVDAGGETLAPYLEPGPAIIRRAASM